MNKFYLALIGLLISYTTSAVSYIEGIEFIKIQKEVQGAPRVVEFFSFYCPHCYQFQLKYRVSQTVAKILPRNIKIERYHINFGGSLGADLTKAWSIAMLLKIEDKVSPLLFEGIQKLDSINTPEDIKAVFIKVGVKNKEYDTILNSFTVKLLMLKQQQAARNFQLYAVPAMFINGKYMIRNNGIIVKDMNYYAKAYSDVVNFLINK